MHTKFSYTNLKWRDHLVDIGVDGGLILKRILENREWECGLHSTSSG